MHHFLRNLLLCLSVSIVLSSCSEEPIMEDPQLELVSRSYVLYSLDKSPYHIVEDLVIPEGGQWIVEPGVEIIIHEGVNVESFSTVNMVGTQDLPIKITPFTPTVGWGKIHIAGPAGRLRMEHVQMTDGILTSAYTLNDIAHCTFVNTQDLDWQYAILRFWHGSVEIQYSSFTGINESEGILLHNVTDASIHDNYVYRVQDGIELIDGIGGEIYNNTIERCLDDGVDLNSCTATKIHNNTFIDNRNSAVELGSNGFGSTFDIELYDNRYEECNRGIFIKESSTAHILRDSFIDNTVGIELQTPEDSSRVTSLIIEHCFFDNNDIDIESDDRSEKVIIN